MIKLNTLLTTGVALAAVYCSGIAFAGDGWSSDYAASKKLAAESKKDLLIDFTGSDWCSWCIKLSEEVFSKDAFKAGVKDKFVLLELDYPKDQSKLSPETIAQNQELSLKYGVEGYPTILLCDAEGRPFASTGYAKGGPEAYLKRLEELRAKKAARDQAFTEASKQEGLVKAKTLIAALKAMELSDAMVQNFYASVSEQIKAADPKDETGYAKEASVKARAAKFQADLQVFAEKEDMDGALGLIDQSLKAGGFDATMVQQIVMTRALIFAQQEKFDEALKAADEAKAAAPESEIATRIDEFKKQIEEAKKASEAPAPAVDAPAAPAEKK